MDKSLKGMARVAGLEPAASGVTGLRHNNNFNTFRRFSLSLTPKNINDLGWECRFKHRPPRRFKDHGRIVFDSIKVLIL